MKSHKFSFVGFVLIALMVLSLGAVSAQEPVTIDWWHISTETSQAAYWQSLADA